MEPAGPAENEPDGAFVRNATDEFNEAWRGRPKGLVPEIEAAVGALTARQIALATQLVEAPSLWNGHSAPLFLQAMAQVHITLTWVINNPEVNAPLLIACGLNQEQDHLNRQWLKQSEVGSESADRLAELGGWIDTQRTIFAGVSEAVDVGWPSVREMADQAGCLEFYELFYLPFEGNARSNWPHLGRYHLKLCGNPDHPFHVVPAAIEEPEPHYVRLAARCLKATRALLAEFLLTAGAPAG